MKRSRNSRASPRSKFTFHTSFCAAYREDIKYKWIHISIIHFSKVITGCEQVKAVIGTETDDVPSLQQFTFQTFAVFLSQRPVPSDCNSTHSRPTQIHCLLPQFLLRKVSFSLEKHTSGKRPSGARVLGMPILRTLSSLPHKHFRRIDSKCTISVCCTNVYSQK